MRCVFWGDERFPLRAEQGQVSAPRPNGPLVVTAVSYHLQFFNKVYFLIVNGNYVFFWNLARKLKHKL